jgi:hypothetical protein
MPVGLYPETRRQDIPMSNPFSVPAFPNIQILDLLGLDTTYAALAESPMIVNRINACHKKRCRLSRENGSL